MWQEIKKDAILQYKLRVRDRNKRSTITTASLNIINAGQFMHQVAKDMGKKPEDIQEYIDILDKNWLHSVD